MPNDFQLIPGMSTPDYAGLAEGNERRRKAIIDLGLKQINAVFGGGSAPFYSTAGGAYSPQSQYFSLQNSGFTPYGSPGKLPVPGVNPTRSPWASQDVFLPGQSGSSPFSPANVATSAVGGAILDIFNPFGDAPESPMHHFQAKEKAGQLFTGQNENFEGFQPSFFKQRAQDYVNYALPQLQQQHQTARQGVEFGLSNRGLYGQSSVRNKMTSEVEREFGQGYQSVQDTGTSQAQQLQQNIENSRQSAINMLYQTGDPSQATSQAISNAAGFKLPSTFTPLANMFSNLVTNYYTNQLLSGSGAPSYVLPPQYTTNTGALGPVSYGGGQ